MKKNWMQLVSLALNVVLLFSVIGLGRKLEESEDQLGMRISNMEYTLRNSVSGISDQVQRELEETSRLASDYSLEPAGLDRETHSLRAEVSVTLRSWRADTEAVLLVEQNGAVEEVPLTQGENGRFTAPVALTTDRPEEIALTLTVTNDGTTVRESLGSWSYISMLLPYQPSSRSSSGSWSYQDGRLMLGTSYKFDVCDQDGRPVSVDDPVYRVYRNEKLVEQSKVLPSNRIDASQEWPEGIACGPGDTVHLVFVCTDDYGLTYEFTLIRWTITEDGIAEETWEEKDEYPRLTWE